MDEAATTASKTRESYLTVQRFLARLWADAGVDVTPFADRVFRTAIRKGSSPRLAADADDNMDEDSNSSNEDINMASIATSVPRPTPGLTIDDVSFSSESDCEDDEYDPTSASDRDDDDDDDTASDISDSTLSDAPGLALQAASVWLGIAGKQIFKSKQLKERWNALRSMFNEAANGRGRMLVLHRSRKGVFLFHFERWMGFNGAPYLL